MFLKKGQSSLEFLMIFGIGFLIILILGGIFFGYIGGAKESLNKDQISNIGNEIINSVEKVYFLGVGNKFILKANFPENINNITIVHLNKSGVVYDYLNISYFTKYGVQYQIFMPSQDYIHFNCSKCKEVVINANKTINYYNDSSDLTGGFKMIQIANVGNWVSVDFYKGE
jgi:uncharacterized protein (UPF0333 family)